MRPNDLGGKRFLVEECQKISIKDYVKIAGRKLKEAILCSELGVNEISVSLTTSQTGFGGSRYWFACPMCGRRVGVIFVHPLTQNIGCRLCLGLEYRKRRYKGMIEGDLS
jgi:hypothetical protein